jgi:hypothetical protein
MRLFGLWNLMKRGSYISYISSNSPMWTVQNMAHNAQSGTSNFNILLRGNRLNTYSICLCGLKNHYSETLSYLWFVFMFLLLYVSLIITSFLITKMCQVKHHTHTQLDNSDFFIPWMLCLSNINWSHGMWLKIQDQWPRACDYFMLFKSWNSRSILFIYKGGQNFNLSLEKFHHIISLFYEQPSMIHIIVKLSVALKKSPHTANSIGLIAHFS